MKVSEILTTPQVSFPLEQEHRDSPLLYCTLNWRQGQLLVGSRQIKQPYLSLLEHEQWLVECLRCSPVRLVRLDLNLGATGIKFWADACQQAHKAVFLRLPSTRVLPRNQGLIKRELRRIIDWSAVALLSLSLSPLILGFALLLYIYSPGPIFARQWRVGQRGKLFQVFKFRATVVNQERLGRPGVSNHRELYQCEDDTLTPLGSWMRKHNLDELPQLLNMLRGEMSLVGPRPWSLDDVILFARKGE